MAKTALTRDEALRQLRKHKPELVKQFGVTTLALVGSTARDEATEDSDIDLLVRFDRPTTSKAFFGVQFYVEDLLERPVDLISENFFPRTDARITWQTQFMSRPNEGARPWHFSVQDMIDSSEKALSYAEGLGKDEFLASPSRITTLLFGISHLSARRLRIYLLPLPGLTPRFRGGKLQERGTVWCMTTSE